MRRVLITAVIALGMTADAVHATEPESSGLDQWKFLIGDWTLVEKRYGFDSKLFQTRTGHSTFSHVMNGQRIQELLTLVHEADTSTALHVFVYDPRVRRIEIARTDSDHYGFSVIGGTMTDARMDLMEKDPNPDSEITRRFTYLRTDDDHFRRQLEFSQDRGESWFVRSEWNYTRK